MKKNARRRGVLLLLFASAVAAYVAEARRSARDLVAPALACSCANAVPPALAPYGGSVPRPRNPRLRFSPVWNVPGYEAWARDNGFDGKQWRLALRKATGPGDAGTIPIEQRVIGEAQERTLEVWPTQPLEPNTTYVIARTDGVIRGSGGWPTLSGTFTTTAVVDSTSPTWAGPTGITYLATGHVFGTSCDVSAPVLDVAIARPEDDTTPEDEIVFGVWVADATGTFAWSAPPLALVRNDRGHVYLGRVALCSEANFDVQNLKTRLGLRAIDLSGNVSLPREVTYDPASAKASPSAAAPAPASGPSAAPAPTSVPLRSSRGCSY